MSFQELLAELPPSTVEQRQLLRRAIDLDEPALSPAEERLVEERRSESIVWSQPRRNRITFTRQIRTVKWRLSSA